jgi:hypothetical protein
MNKAIKNFKKNLNKANINNPFALIISLKLFSCKNQKEEYEIVKEYNKIFNSINQKINV